MYRSIHPNGTQLIGFVGNRSPWRCSLSLIAVALTLFNLSPLSWAVDPPPGGGYPGENTAVGDSALFSLTSGRDNTALGFRTLFSDKTGFSNTATGSLALENNSSGSNNTADGVDTLANNTTGVSNTAIGSEALNSNTTGKDNTATGVTALFNNTIGNFNTATGQNALTSNTTGTNNTADGQNALRSNTTGSNNIAVGSNAGFNLTSGQNNIDLGNRGVAGETKTIRIGKQGTQNATFIAGIDGSAVSGSGVVVGEDGRLGVAPSSERFKRDIQKMGIESDALLNLTPVTFRYKAEIDSKGMPQFGLVAEAVAKVDPDLVTRDDTGRPYTVRYEAVNAMLLNEFLKEHRKVLELERDLHSTIEQQRKQIETLSAALTLLKTKHDTVRPGVQTVVDP